MPRKRQPGQHLYSVFVDTLADDGTITSQLVYFGNSEYTARMKLAQAIMENPRAYTIDVRRDMRLLVRVKLERPSLP
jgi:hypothetical protein